MKLAALFTGGKDSTYAIQQVQKKGHEVVCLITIKSKNPDSYMFHTPAIELTSIQSEAMGIPIIFGESLGKKELELVDLENIIKEAQQKFQFNGIITGALFSEYQSSRIKNIALKLGLEVISPLWHKSQEQLMQELLDNHFEFIMTSIAADGLDQTWLNKIITQEDLDKLNKLKDKIGSNVAGEGGEFESLVLNCPLFKQKIVIKKARVLIENKHIARLVIDKVSLVPL